MRESELEECVSMKKFTFWGVTVCKLGHSSLCLSYKPWPTHIDFYILYDVSPEVKLWPGD